MDYPLLVCLQGTVRKYRNVQVHQQVQSCAQFSHFEAVIYYFHILWGMVMHFSLSHGEGPKVQITIFTKLNIRFNTQESKYQTCQEGGNVNLFFNSVDEIIIY